MKALITGINGFVGPYLKRCLLENNFEVDGTDISAGEDVDYRVDLLDKGKIEDLITKIKPELIFHLAAQSSVKKSWENPELTTKINVEGTRNLLDAVLKAGINPKILTVGSGEIYGTTKKVPFKETSPLNPNSPYSKSRLAQEKLVRNYFDRFGINVIISRSFPHTGPSQSPTFVCSGFAKQIAEIEKGMLESIKVGNLEAKRDYTDVRDMTKAYLFAIERCVSGEIYNICSGKAFSISSILDILTGLSNAKIKVEKDHTKMRPSDIPILLGDNTKFIEQTGWKPEIPFEKTLKDILDYWRAKV